jgi:hypothetical protein
MIRIQTYRSFEEAEMTEREKFNQHGSWMWFAWTVCGYLLLASRRYFKKYYHASQAMHMVAGFWVLLLSLIFGLKAWNDVGWKVEHVHVHTVFGFFMLASVLLVGALGIA